MNIRKTVMTKKDVLSIIQKNQDKFRILGVKRLGLFGSFVREEQNMDSDVDLLVEFEQGKKTFDNFIRLSFLLEELLQRRIELVTNDSLSPYIRPYIVDEVEYATLTN